jgi:serine/threonine-protein kinase HipA
MKLFSKIPQLNANAHPENERNQSHDHAKNFSFQVIDGEWKLSPAYDLLPSTGFNGQHTTSVNGNGILTKEDILTVAHRVGLKAEVAREIYDEIFAICSQ